MEICLPEKDVIPIRISKILIKDYDETEKNSFTLAFE